MKSLDCTLEHRRATPENVALAFDLAGPGPRFAAFLIDLAIRLALWTAGLVVFGILALAFEAGSIGLFLVLWFALDWLYGTLFEALFQGRTPGKAVVGLRVIRIDGSPIGLYEAFIRNLLRAADLQPFYSYGVGLIAAGVSPRFQRLGDRAANTIVIEDRRLRLASTSRPLASVPPFGAGELGRSYRPPAAVLAAIERLLARTRDISDARRDELARILVDPLATRLGYKDDPGPPFEFLLRTLRTFAAGPTTLADPSRSAQQAS